MSMTMPASISTSLSSVALAQLRQELLRRIVRSETERRVAQSAKSRNFSKSAQA